MAYSDFTLATVVKQFSLTIDETRNLYADVREITVSDFLQTLLRENIPLALAISTEKARSELIIAPVLVELRKLAQKRISLFSGVDFTVDPALGLSGVCDFIISRSAEQLYVSAPILMLAEAKNEDMKRGYAQCIAEMVAARTFNERESIPSDRVYGAVTTGSNWKFLQLEGSTVAIDMPEYYISEVDKILGILLRLAS